MVDKVGWSYLHSTRVVTTSKNSEHMRVEPNVNPRVIYKPINLLT